MNNFKKILMACTGLIMCNSITLNAADKDMNLNHIDINSADIPSNKALNRINPFYIENQYAELSNLCDALNEKIKIIDQLTNTRQHYQDHVEDLVDRIQKYKKDPYNSTNLSSIKSKISRFQNNYFNKNDIKVLSNEIVYTDVTDILKQISDKFNHIVETINKNSDIPINLNACKELLNKLSDALQQNTNDFERINKQYQDVNNQYIEISKKPKPYTKQIMQTYEILQQQSIQLSKNSLQLSNQALNLSLLLSKAQEFQRTAQILKNNTNITKTNIINCYKLFMEIYQKLRDDPEYKSILHSFDQFYSYVVSKYSEIIVKENLPY